MFVPSSVPLAQLGGAITGRRLATGGYAIRTASGARLLVAAPILPRGRAA